MRRFAGTCVVLGLVAFGVALAEDKAEKLSPDKLPKAVANAIKARFPEAKVTSAEKEVEDGKTVFDIELTSGGTKYEADILEDGTIIEIEKEIKEAPEAVTKGVMAKYPKAKIVEVMERYKVKDKKETLSDYEITIEDGGKKTEVVVSLDGKTVKTEAEEKKEKK
jgi:uncharacterized membrane protein YkoI